MYHCFGYFTWMHLFSSTREVSTIMPVINGVDEESEAHRASVTCPRLHCWWVGSHWTAIQATQESSSGVLPAARRCFGMTWPSCPTRKQVSVYQLVVSSKSSESMRMVKWKNTHKKKILCGLSVCSSVACFVPEFIQSFRPWVAFTHHTRSSYRER